MVSTQVLKKTGLFKQLSSTQLTKIAVFARERTLEAGALCFAQGRKATELHICGSGRVDIVVQLREPWGIEVVVHTATEGEVFGWSALVEPHVYTASARCAEKTQDIYIKGSDLFKLFEEDPLMGYAVMKNLSALISSRLTETRQKLSVQIAAADQKEW